MSMRWMKLEAQTSVPSLYFLLFSRNKIALEQILQAFDEAGYSVKYELLNVVNYSVPQDRKRVIFVGFRKDLNIDFEFPQTIETTLTLKDCIHDLQDTARPAKEKNYTNGADLPIMNHEHMIGGFSTMFMSRNRVRTWDEPSFTIQANYILKSKMKKKKNTLNN